MDGIHLEAVKNGPNIEGGKKTPTFSTMNGEEDRGTNNQDTTIHDLYCKGFVVASGFAFVHFLDTTGNRD